MQNDECRLQNEKHQTNERNGELNRQRCARVGNKCDSLNTLSKQQQQQQQRTGSYTRLAARSFRGFCKEQQNLAGDINIECAAKPR